MVAKSTSENRLTQPTGAIRAAGAATHPDMQSPVGRTAPTPVRSPTRHDGCMFEFCLPGRR